MSSDVLSELRERIVGGYYPPGVSLSEKQLAEDFSVSRTPIREALVRLESEQLVASTVGRGFYTKEASIQECREVTIIRLHLLSLVGQLATAHATPETIDQFRELLADMQDEDDLQRLKGHDVRFHRLVNKAAHNRALAELDRRLANQFARIRNSLDPRLDDTHFIELKADLPVFIASLEARDPERCTEVLTEHLHRFVRQIFCLTC